MPEPVDVAIVGGGVMGCAIAWQLAKSGVSLRAGGARSLRRWRLRGRPPEWSGRFGTLTPDDPDMFRLGMRSLDLFPLWAAELAEQGVNPEFQQTGVLKIASSRRRS